MIYHIGNRSLNIPEATDSKRLKTPGQCVGWRDMAETCRTLDAVCHTIKGVSKRPIIVDGIARSGFWSAVFQNHWPDAQLVLNDEHDGCADILKANFPKARVSQKDIHKMVLPASDIAMLDFDKFTLRTIEPYVKLLDAWGQTTDNFIIVDGACFGWKFGNLRHYGINTPEEYFPLLDKALNETIGMYVTSVSSFCNATTVLLKKNKPKQIEILPPSTMQIMRGSNKYTGKKKPQSGLGLV